MNERSPDMTPNRVLLDVSVMLKKQKQNIQQTSNFN